MNKDIIDFNVLIQQPGQLALWLAALCALGFIITCSAMQQVSKFFFYKKETKQLPATQNLYARFSVFNFQLPFNYSRFEEIIKNISDKTKEAVKRSLHIDYYFMPFAYLLLFFLSFYFYLGTNEANRINIFLLLPFISWVMDIIENNIAAACLTRLTPLKARLLLIVSAVKWLSVAASVLYIFACLSICIIQCFK